MGGNRAKVIELLPAIVPQDQFGFYAHVDQG